MLPLIIILNINTILLYTDVHLFTYEIFKKVRVSMCMSVHVCASIHVWCMHACKYMDAEHNYTWSNIMCNNDT